MRQIRILSASAILGYGFPEASLRAGLERGVDMIGVDGGSSDPGPYYLGAGRPFTSPLAIRRDLRLLLHAAIEARVPLMIGTSGGAGANAHLDLVAGMVREIAAQDGLHFKLALIRSEQDKATIADLVRAGRSHPLRGRAALDEATVERAHRIVGLMGPEPYMQALDEGAQVVLAGRSTDPAPFVAAATRAQLPPAPSWYAGKMLECGASASLPKGHDCLHVTIREDSVDIEPTNPARRCTPESIANFSLHENASPIHHYEPGGMLDTEDARFEALSDRAVRVSGMRWVPAERYSIKLEAAEFVGHRAIAVAGTRDPMLIGRLDSFLDSVRGEVARKVADFGIGTDDYRLTIHCYGRDGVMGAREPVKAVRGHEVGFVIDVVAADEERAGAVIAMARTNMLHTDFPGRLCREGNMAFPFSPADLLAGPVYRFSMAHVVYPDDPLSLFPIEHESL